MVGPARKREAVAHLEGVPPLRSGNRKAALLPPNTKTNNQTPGPNQKLS